MRCLKTLIWWRIWDSNPRPLRCQRSALPAELIPHVLPYIQKPVVILLPYFLGSAINNGELP